MIKSVKLAKDISIRISEIEVSFEMDEMPKRVRVVYAAIKKESGETIVHKNFAWQQGRISILRHYHPILVKNYKCNLKFATLCEDGDIFLLDIKSSFLKKHHFEYIVKNNNLIEYCNTKQVIKKERRVK
ncbi:MAG: hypothetical protein J6L59_03310 [Clostridia bacterium]|nr:hypothetical protein [Clostridia bacterium]